MRARWAWAAVIATMAGAVTPVAAQQPAAPAQGQVGQGQASQGQAGQWSATVNKDAAGAGVTLDEKQVAALRSVSKFFNDMKTLKGSFAQTNPDGKKMRGKFTLKQPGKFRFDYGFGSRLVITSDGNMLAIQDKDISTDDRIELDRTPFRILLRRDVDLMRDARIFEVQEVEDLVIVALGDKSPDAPGKIRLFFSKKPALELKEWVTTDGQGADTRVEVSDLNRTEEADDAAFKIQAVGLGKSQ